MKIKNIYILVYLITFSIIINSVYAYEMSPPDRVTHQHMTNESKEIWISIPYEMKIHIDNPINLNLDAPLQADYDNGDDVITGSGEEDRALDTILAVFGNHFWQPDNPDTILMLGNDDYNDGLNTPLPQDSSYRRALEFWTMNVIPNYLNGNVNESYYWLGRVAHLLQDVSQPSHVLMDPHPIFSILEDYAGNESVYSQYDGKTYENQTYKYENLIPNFDWVAVEPTRAPDKWYIELFRLFWYTAQKTQYFASDDREQNFDYTRLDGSTGDWQCSGTADNNLWKDEGLTSCSDFTTQAQLQSNVAQEADAVIPHAMKSVAGLYRLFWDAVQID